MTKFMPLIKENETKEVIASVEDYDLLKMVGVIPIHAKVVCLFGPDGLYCNECKAGPFRTVKGVKIHKVRKHYDIKK